MKQIIKDVLDDMSESQVNLASSAARETVSSLISAALKTNGFYKEYTDYELDEQKARAAWVCSICGENTFEVDYDYIGSGYNHLGCELKSQEDIDEYIEDIDEQAYAQGRGSSKTVQTLDDGGGITYREKNWLQKKHENKVFGGDTGVDADFGHDMGGNYEIPTTNDDSDIPEGLKRAKELAQEAIKEGLQKQAYMEMTSDGLPEGGDAQAVLESHKLADEIVYSKKNEALKLAEEIVEAQEGTWIYESPDGGKTVFRRPFSDYDPKNKEEIDWKTKEPTGRKFTDYNNGNWGSKDNE